MPGTRKKTNKFGHRSLKETRDTGKRSNEKGSNKVSGTSTAVRVGVKLPDLGTTQTQSSDWQKSAGRDIDWRGVQRGVPRIGAELRILTSMRVPACAVPG